MKAAVQTGVRQFEVREVPDPTLPEDGLILRVTACGVCGSDLRRWREGLPAGVDGIIPGHEIAGEVIAVGPKAARVAVGDRLALAPDIHCGHCWYCRRGLYNLCDDMRMLGITPGYPGGFAELLAVSGDVLTNGIVHPVPDGLPDELAALAEPCSSVLASHMKTNTSLNDTVVVIGAGPIGCLLVATAHARGARAFIVVRSERAPRVGRTLCARCDHRQQPGGHGRPRPCADTGAGCGYCDLRQSRCGDTGGCRAYGAQGRQGRTLWRPAQGATP